MAAEKPTCRSLVVKDSEPQRRHAPMGEIFEGDPDDLPAVARALSWLDTFAHEARLLLSRDLRGSGLEDAR